MKTCIIDTERNTEQRYQIMRNSGTLFEHLYPGKLFTLNQAKEICKQNNIEVYAIGTMWECLDKDKGVKDYV